MLVCACLLLNGCTAMLWEEGRFAQFHKAADPANLKLYYSEQRRDVLVLFDEITEDEPPARLRAYWLEPNTKNILNRSKPHFVPPESANGLTPISLVPSTADASPAVTTRLYAVVSTNGGSFTLSSNQKNLVEQELPVYYDGSGRRVAQVLLTPVAVAVDLTIVGAVVAVCVAPYFAMDYAKEEQYQQGH
jgi:hypothetical protein